MPIDKTNCVIINPNNIASYVNTVKRALLLYDEAFVIPKCDAMWILFSRIPLAMDQVSSRSTESFKELANRKLASFTAQRGLFYFLTPEGQNEFKESLAKDIKKFIKPEFQKEAVIEEAEHMIPKIKVQLKELERELAPLTKEGIVHTDLDEGTLEQLSSELGLDFAESFKAVLENMAGSFFGESKQTVSSPEEVAYSLWAKQASSLVANLDSPLLTTSDFFMKKIHNTGTINRADQPTPLEEFKTQKISFSLSDIELPSLDHLTCEDILEVRRITGDTLGYFRKKLGTFSTKLRNQPWESNLDCEIEELFKKEVLPALKEAESQFRKHPPLLKIIRNAFQGFKKSRERLSVIGDVFSDSEPLLLLASAMEGVCAGIDEYFVGETDLSSRNGLVFFVKTKTILDDKSSLT